MMRCYLWSTAAGLPGANLPGNGDQFDPPRDLKWFGNHAPTELEKLLDLCGWTFVPGLGYWTEIDPEVYDCYLHSFDVERDQMELWGSGWC